MKKKGLRKREREEREEEGGRGRKEEEREEKGERGEGGREDERRSNVMNGYIGWNEEINDFYLIILCILLDSNSVVFKLHGCFFCFCFL